MNVHKFNIELQYRIQEVYKGSGVILEGKGLGRQEALGEVHSMWH